MDEKLLILMADLDEETQRRMSEWYCFLRKAGFPGTQTPGLPYHISLATFPPDQEQHAADNMREAAKQFQVIPVQFSHIGLFPGGRVLFAAPERNAILDALHDACVRDPEQRTL